MPIEVRRFGVGHRRPQGPPGTVGVEGQPIHADEQAVIAELAFARGGRIEAHSNPNTTWFVVIEGGGWVQVADEQRRVAAGEAILWPADVIHSAWTDHGQMRAIVVELTGPGEGPFARILDGRAVALPAGQTRPATRGEGALGPREIDPDQLDRSSGEPL